MQKCLPPLHTEKHLVPDFRLLRELVPKSAHLRTENTRMGRFPHQFTHFSENRHRAFLEGGSGAKHSGPPRA